MIPSFTRPFEAATRRFNPPPFFEARITRIASSLFLISSAIFLSSFGSTPSKTFAKTFIPFISFISEVISEAAFPRSFAFMDSISFLCSFSCFSISPILCSMFSLVVFSLFSTDFMSSSFFRTYLYDACPVTASILLTPAATPVSETILKSPISEVFLTWVPPQSSIENFPIFRTLTTSPYLLSKSPVTPSSFASLSDFISVTTGIDSKTFSFTILSTSFISSSVIA